MSILAAIIVAAFLRAWPLMENRFHPDEALYASFGLLIASGQDPLLAGVVVDKPPLTLYLVGLSFAVFGQNELAARLPSWYASVVSVALLWALGRKLYDAATANIAAWLLALSPFAILFSITFFLDPLLTVLVLWGLLPVRDGRWQALAWALAFATKQTALLFLPLALALHLARLPAAATPGAALRAAWGMLKPCLLALAVTTVLIFAWDAVRQGPIGFWDQGYSDNIPGRFVRAEEVALRAWAWLDLLRYFTAADSLNLLFVLCLPLLLLTSAETPTRAGITDFILVGFNLCYLASYWLLAFNIFDRYLLPLVPLFALLCARVLRFVVYALKRAAYGIWRMADGRPQVTTTHSPFAMSHPPSAIGYRLSALVPQLLVIVFFALLLSPAWAAAQSAFPVGGDHGAYDGIDETARVIRTLPEGSVLYDYWLSWEWRFYLFGGPVYVAWLPTPAALTTELQAFGETSPRYLVVPSWEANAEIRAAAAQAGYEFKLLHTAYRRDGQETFKLYQLTPQP